MVLLFDIHCVPFELMLICFLYCLPYNEIALKSIWIKDTDRILFDFVCFYHDGKRRFEIVTKQVNERPIEYIEAKLKWQSIFKDRMRINIFSP